jgi:CcmD family protein
MNKLKRIVSVILFTILSVAVQAQDTAEDATSVMRSNGKIYVVVAVVVTILLGLFFYVFNLDRKISKLEKKG